MENGYPEVIQMFQNNILKLKGVKSVESGVESLGGITNETLGLYGYAHMPHAALAELTAVWKMKYYVSLNFSLKNLKLVLIL